MNKPAILILHGWNLSGKRYAELSGYFRNHGYRVYSPDFPGFGTNSTIDHPLTLCDYTRFIASFLETNKIKSAVFICHSFGGRVGIRFTAHNPKKVQLLILTGVPGYPPHNGIKVRLFYIFSKLLRETVFTLLPGRLTDVIRKSVYRIAGSYDYYKATGNLKETLRNVISEDLSVYMRKLSVPTVLVWGKAEKTVPIHVARKMQDTISGSRLVLVPGAGHSLPYSHAGVLYETTVKAMQELELTKLIT